ncbi:PREDICTED: uncharacterized protein LOC108375694, partial [Rhagoletis zephyria]|uniref:uncharacterized protein LOC108375694 n=1 Tax=Rhagoletis zephyria TaxID=28612 RepID=UPI00081123D5
KIILCASVVYQENAPLLVIISVSQSGEFLFLGNSVCEMTINYKHSIINGDCKNYWWSPNRPGIRTKRHNHRCGKYVPAVLPTAVGVMISIAEQTPSPGDSHMPTIAIISRVNATAAKFGY